MKTRPDIDELFRLYYRPLCMYGARFLGDADAVEDVVQAAFVSLWERLQAGFDGDGQRRPPRGAGLAVMHGAEKQGRHGQGGDKAPFFVDPAEEHAPEEDLFADAYI